MTAKKPTSQAELFSTDASWVHIFKEIVRSKVWANLSPLGAKAYVAVKAFTSWDDGEAFPSIDTLQEYSGLARASVIKGLKELEEKGLLKRDNKRGKGSSYKLVEQFEVTDGTGRPAASVSFDYMPGYVGDAVAELKNFIANGLTLDGKAQFIKIENLTLNIVRGDQYNQTNNQTIDTNLVLKGVRDMLEKKDTPEAEAVRALSGKSGNEKG